MRALRTSCRRRATALEGDHMLAHQLIARFCGRAFTTVCSNPRSRQCSRHGSTQLQASVSSASVVETHDVAAPASSEGPSASSTLGTSAKDWELEMEELLKLVALLPPSVRAHIEEHPQMPELLEVVMDLGRPPLARFPSGDVRLGDGVVSPEDLELAVKQVGEFGGDNRAGIDRTLHRISCIRNRSGRIIGLTCRVGRAIKGSARLVSDLVTSGASILFLGRPGVGKTTVIREVSRALADELDKRVVIVDTSNEIGGDGDIPHDGIGRARRIQVPHPDAQHRVMIEAVENHMPQVVVIDEIGTEEECAAARTIAQRGVQLVATAHGNELENVVKNPSLADLVGGIQSVTLGDEEARKRGVQKSILERGGPPTFDVAVEMLERTKWRIHLDTAQAVDLLLAGGSPGGQVRERLPDGSIRRYTYDPAVSNTLGRSTREPGSSGNGSGPTTTKAAKAAAAAALAAQEAAAAVTSLPRGPARSSPASSLDASASSTSSNGSLSGGTAPEGSNGSTTRDSSASAGGSSSSEGSSPSGPGSMADMGPEEAALLAQSVGAAAAATAASSFVKRSVLGAIEAKQEAEELALQLEDDGVPAQKGARRLASRQALLAVQAGEVVLRLFPYELDADKLWEVMSAMDLTRRVLIVRRVAQADAVLGLRTRVKTDAALRQAAKASRVPIYAIKASGTANLVRALRTLLGIDPSAGGVFVRSNSSSAAGSTDPGIGSTDGGESSSDDVAINDSAGQPSVAGTLRAELDISTVQQQQQVEAGTTASPGTRQGGATTASEQGVPSSSTVQEAQPQQQQQQGEGTSPRPHKSGQEKEALEEAHAACVNLVALLNQPVELLPRPQHIIEAQQQVVEAQGLGWQLLGSGPSSRLKVLPKAA